MFNRIKWWRYVIYLSIYLQIICYDIQNARGWIHYDRIYCKKWWITQLNWCAEAYDHEAVVHWPRRYSVRSHFVGLKVQSYCLIQEVAWVNTKDQIISPFSNRMFWTGTALQHKNHSGMFLFTDAEVCVTAFVTEAHWFACVQGKTPFISSIQIFLPSVCHNGFFIMHEGAHNPD